MSPTMKMATRTSYRAWRIIKETTGWSSVVVESMDALVIDIKATTSVEANKGR